jgi:hypothetical protein
VAASTTPDWVKPAAIAVAIALIIALVVAVTSGGNDKKQAAGPGEIFLQPISEPGPDPFGPDVSTPLPPNTIPPSTLPATATTASGGNAPKGPLTLTAQSGATRGLYGGTKDQSRCDKQGMIDFLNQNPAKKAAWAGVEGISTSDVPAYIDALTPVVLRSDTRVTNHGFKNGRANGYQAILQTGTAVLIDNRGVPRARCACGNPLTPPVAVPTTPTYTGDPWPGFSPANVTVINQSTTIINNITIIDIQTGDTINVTINNNNNPPGTTPGTSPPNTGTRGTTPGTVGGGGGGSVFRLTNVDVQIADKSHWSADGNAGTAHGNFDPNSADYRWSVPQTIDPNGTNFDYGGTAKGNVAIDINVYVDDGDAYISPADTDTRAVNCYDSQNGCTASKTAVISARSTSQRFVLKVAMGFAISALYTYER